MRRWILFVIDLILIAVATELAFILRENFDLTTEKALAFLPHLGLTMLTSIAVIPLLGLHRSVWRFSAMKDYLYLLAASALIVLGAVVLGFTANRLEGVARSVPLIQVIMILLLLVSARVFMRLRHTGRRAPATQFSGLESGGQLSAPAVVIVGINRLTELYLQSAQELTPGRLNVAGLVGNGDKHTGRLMHRYPVLGKTSELPEILKQLEVHGVIVGQILITGLWSSLTAAEQAILREIESTSNVRVTVLAAVLGFTQDGPAPAAPSSLPDASTPALGADFAADVGEQQRMILTIGTEEREALGKNRYWVTKRMLDAIGSLVLIVLLSPLMAITAILVLIDIGRPIQFWQQRPGLGGRPFRVYKFRTMRAAHDEDGRPIPDSDRLSPVGRFMRRTRLDELPQLFLILSGRMSFVGPRPLLPVDQPVGYEARLMVRPGLTGWAQVRGGRNISAIDKAALDVWYVRNASFLLDLEVLFRTCVTVFLGEKPDAAAIDAAWNGHAPRSSSGYGLIADGLALQGSGITKRQAS